MTLLFCGDLHADLVQAEKAIELAEENDATIVQVGDWGFLWPREDRINTLDLMLRNAGVSMLFCDGNHDDHPRLREGRVDCARYITYMPRGSVTVLDGKAIMFLGGAPSIDRTMRTPGKTWWAEEEITEEDVQACLSFGAKVDILVTHDAPVIPPGFRTDVAGKDFQARAEASHEKVARVARHHKPSLLVHGHFHRRYSREWEGIQIEGLASNMQKFEEMVLLV